MRAPARCVMLVSAALLGACASLGSGVDRDDSAAVCIARDIREHGLGWGDSDIDCPAQTLTVARAPESDCQQLRAYLITGCTRVPSGEPIVELLWVEGEVVGDQCLIFDSTAGICFE